jgi:hypothetical protein
MKKLHWIDGMLDSEESIIVILIGISTNPILWFSFHRK